MSLQDIYEGAKETCLNLKRVKTGEKASPQDFNQLVDCIEKMLELALNIGLGGALPYWAPILDIGKLDYMIVGEPIRDVNLYKIPFNKLPSVFMIKPVYGYLSETDLALLTTAVNSESHYLDLKESLPRLRFGNKLTSDYYNQLSMLVWKIAERSGLPCRFLSLEPDARAKAKFKLGINYKYSQAVLSIFQIKVGHKLQAVMLSPFSLSLSVEVRLE